MTISIRPCSHCCWSGPGGSPAQLLAYALGRGLTHADRPTVRAIVRDAAADDYRWSALVAGIVKSPAFLMRNAAAER